MPAAQKKKPRHEGEALEPPRRTPILGSDLVLIDVSAEVDDERYRFVAFHRIRALDR